MRLLHIAWWDLRRVAKDRRALLWMLAMPLVFMFIFGSTFRAGGPHHTLIPVIDLDRSALSDLFIEQMRGEGYWVDVKGATNQLEMKQKWPCGVVLPAGFHERIVAGQRVQLTVVKGWASQETILDVQSRLTWAIVRFTKALAMTDTSHRPWDTASRDGLKAVLGRPELLTVARRGDVSLRPPPSGFQQSLPGILVMFVLQMSLTYGGVTLVSDRVRGQFTRLLAAPVSAAEVYIGKVLGRILLALVQAVLLLACGSVFFQVPLGDHPEYLAPVVLCFALFAGSLSIVTGLLCHTEKQVVQVAICVSMLLAALGGSWWPIEVVPETFKTIARCTPTYWGLHGLQSVIYFNQSTEVLLLECPLLLGFAAPCLALTVPLARRLAARRSVATS